MTGGRREDEGRASNRSIPAVLQEVSEDRIHDVWSPDIGAMSEAIEEDEPRARNGCRNGLDRVELEGSIRRSMDHERRAAHLAWVPRRRIPIQLGWL